MLGIDSYDRPVSFTPGTHTGIFGRTGTGKTNLLEHIAATAIDSGICIIDPHGELVDRFLGLIPDHRKNDVILIDPLADRVPGINFLEGGEDALLIEHVVRLFKNLWGDAWGARSEWLLANITYALLAAGPASLVSIGKSLTSSAYRRELATGADPYLEQFFSHFNSWTPAFRQEVITPILNKATRLTLNPHIRAVLGQATSSFSFTEAMDEKRIILVRLPRGLLGEASTLLGCAIFTKLTLAALERKTTDPYLVVVDEAHTFTKGVDLPVTLAECRKYGLFVTLATQNLELLSLEDRAGIFANCGTLISFRTSAQDAKVIAPELGSDWQPRAVQNLPNFHALYRTMGKDMPTPPVVLRVAPPLTPQSNGVREESLRRWGHPKDKVEARIRRHLRR
jgi:hypothetical protein